MKRETVRLTFQVEATPVRIMLLRGLLRDPRRARWFRILLAHAVGYFLAGGDQAALPVTVTGGSLSNSEEVG